MSYIVSFKLDLGRFLGGSCDKSHTYVCIILALRVLHTTVSSFPNGPVCYSEYVSEEGEGLAVFSWLCRKISEQR